MGSLDVSRGQYALLQDRTLLENLPPELLEIIRQESSPNFLDAIAYAALEPAWTLKFFTYFENVFADSCARWIARPDAQSTYSKIVGAFSRILPFAPHLHGFLQKYLLSHSPNSKSALPGPSLRYLSLESEDDPKSLPEVELQRVLLAAFRLLNFDRSSFSRAISASRIQDLLEHGDLGVRYLAVRVLSQLLSASEMKLEAMIQRHVGKDKAINGDFDGLTIDYGFLSLYEQRRGNWVQKLRQSINQLPSKGHSLRPELFSPNVTSYGGVLLPRPDGPPSKSSLLVKTTTTSANMETFAKALLTSSPILIHGLAGSGKTSIVNDFAREFRKDSTMVTLHLNEQTDAKMLIGMYTTDATPGSFSWRPGVLSTAVREGYWVFIEDLDRAPNEVISVILPLIERRELLIHSRGETIRAAPGFRLIASIRTSVNVVGEEIPPSTHTLGARLWERVAVKMPSRDEFREIIHGLYPLLNRFLPNILSVYDRLYLLFRTPSFVSRNKTSLNRAISPRDLLKWCRRLNTLLTESGSKTGNEPISEALADEMFLEAIDCFAGGLQDEEAKKSVVGCIAEELQIPPQRVEHFFAAHVPRYDDGEKFLVIGRGRLPKRQSSSRVTKSYKRPRPFANTVHAKRLLEQVGVALKMAEPILLVGETGIGKTTVVQQLAEVLGFKLTVVNLSQQSEVGDLLGGFKPVNVRSLAIPLKEEFDELFAATGISATKNQKYLEQLGKCMAKAQWTKVSKLWHEAPRMFDKILSDITKLDQQKNRDSSEQPLKRRKMESKLQSLVALKPRWIKFAQDLTQFDIQLSGESKGFAFKFVEGNIVKAVRNGEWVLLDEINLASPDTLESIADLLHSGTEGSPSILLSETGETERVQAHPDFRIFGAMNPATDVGKRDLPMSLRSRFTEIYVESPDRSLDDLLAVIKAYLKDFSNIDERAAHDIARLYLNTKRLADEKHLVDGANQVPHFSLRTLTRVLSYVVEIAPLYGLRRALYEGFAMGFLTLLNRESEQLLIPLIDHHLLDTHGNPRALLAQTPRRPDDGRRYVKFSNKKGDRQYWMLQGHEIPQAQPHYIITPFVERNMLNLVRATSTRRFPVLIQGPTSAGKTSMIEYLAKFSGNKFVRINNHEHTDLQEYLGTYVSGADGQLRFQEGLLVQALRQGHWIVLDELNLAPTDVLEALNRLLDDNRELLIPETQEVVRPHENFMLFATQNPPGLYGGRKTLSRAFRNRFLELHFDDIPEDELEYILQHRSQKTAPSDCKRIVTVYKELSRLRQSTRVFEQKDSFATLRDLFRWALRDADNREQLAANGYMLLGERVRKAEERLAVKEIIEKVMKVKVDPTVLYDHTLSQEVRLHKKTANKQGVVWTRALARLYILVAQALKNNEPVLLVGETGCGKTTVCQMLAEAFGKELHIVNAHQNTETGDLIGAQRPVRNRASILKQLQSDLVEALRKEPEHALIEQEQEDNIDSLLAAYSNLAEDQRTNLPEELRLRIASNHAKSKALFEWADGSLVQAMKDGQFFLLDEISLADDSVLERLNSVLESHRTILLAEKGVENSFVQARDGFQFLATMNPGGDYGKRELSPALRNRFTEIWVPHLSEMEDVLQIVESKFRDELKPFAKAVVEFAEWFGQTYRSSETQTVSIRDVLAWISFANQSSTSDPYYAILHGAAMVYIDTLGANPAALLAISPESIYEERSKCLQYLSKVLSHDVNAVYNSNIAISNNDTSLKFGSFSLSKRGSTEPDVGFAFDAPTTKLNAMRVVRALQVNKPILLEGSPGVGKTTLIAALARATGNHLTRINLSEQTDLMDLFGSDTPVEGEEAGNFAWHDAPFLQAMQRGEWVLLDEMNLASQSVLEGLNACLDHRGEVYISELDQTFKRHPDFTVFAAQNPHHQGGGRKGLPSSFVNRFTVVYADVFRIDDLTMICKQNYPAINDTIMSNLIKFVSTLEERIVHNRQFGFQGGPWEFNLRDTLRWLQLLNTNDPLLIGREPSDFLNIIFRQRFRTPQDRDEVNNIFAEVFSSNPPARHLFHNAAPDFCQVGIAYLPRNPLIQPEAFPSFNMVPHLQELESIMICVQQNIPCILVGPSGSGKSSLVQHVAAAAGAELVVFPLNSEIDTMDLVGGFEQADSQRAINSLLKDLLDFLGTRIMSSIPEAVPSEALVIMELCRNAHTISSNLLTVVGQYLVPLRNKSGSSELDTFIQACQKFVVQHDIKAAQFEWVDGILIDALEQGKWLVLDNANLCSSSVLDRLNSLLEPNGVLSINEHCGPDGLPKIVTPHPNFRLFITMDPRFGELSRAMRNRSVEIYVDLQNTDPALTTTNNTSLIKTEAVLDRYGTVIAAVEDSEASNEQLQGLAGVALDHLSISDVSSLPRFAAALTNGLLQVEQSPTQMLQIIGRYGELLKPGKSENLRAAIGDLYSGLGASMNLSQGFTNAQPIHPLSNSPLVPVLQQQASAVSVCYWLGALSDLSLDILEARDIYDSQERSLETLKASQMNRLQRSIVRERISTVVNDSTSMVSTFLLDTLNALHHHVQQYISGIQNWKNRSRTFKSLLRFWSNTYDLAITAEFDEAAFQAHLSIGRDLFAELLADADEFNKLVQVFQDKLQQNFDFSFKLSTGLSMELLWPLFRPIPIRSLETLAVLLEIESLAGRFDALRWKVTISVPELTKILSSLVEVYRLVLVSDVDGKSLVQELKLEFDRLESGIANTPLESEPFFKAQFESLRQYNMLKLLTSNEPVEHQLFEPKALEIAVLGASPTKSLLKLASKNELSQTMYHIDYLYDVDDRCQPIRNSFSVSFLQRLLSVQNVNLNNLRLLEVELPILGKQLVHSGDAISSKPVSSLNSVLRNLIVSVINAHDQDLAKVFESWVPRSTDINGNDNVTIMPDGTVQSNGQVSLSLVHLTVPDHLLAVLHNYFIPAVLCIAASNRSTSEALKYSSFAWLLFGLGLVTLYVPDRLYDPDKRKRLEREQHAKVKKDLEKKLSALQRFEKIFTNQADSLRSFMLEEELRDWGEPAEQLQQILRPEISELEQLQGEFNNLLKVVLKPDLKTTIAACLEARAPAALQELKLMKANLTQIFHRLSSRFRAYSDMTVPVVNVLRCLQLGLDMAEVESTPTSTEAAKIHDLGKLTPFLGGTKLSLENQIHDQPFEVLGKFALVSSIEGVESFDAERRTQLSKIFHSVFEQWSQRLEADRVEAESKSGLYRFKGSAEDEEEEDQEQFNELFPTYEENASNPIGGIIHHSSRDTAISLARVHRKIFLDANGPVDEALSLLRQVASRIGSLSQEDSVLSQSQLVEEVLPGVTILIDDQIEAFKSTASADTYNFYVDSNLIEARKLVELVHQIQNRFHELQNVDEIAHMQPLEDVLVSCRELLEFKHTEPLAKIITKVEKTHAFMHEWQFGGWASRANSALPLYDRLTATIVSWRRLELSTWSRLFEMENRKCADDANSWWFIAYQVIVSAPLSLSDSETELKSYAPKLLKDLETYFSSSIQGQFSQRLQIVIQLQRHLEMLIKDVPTLQIINSAVKNFLDFYSRYEQPVLDSLRRGRQGLEKAMKDVVLLASWKDTNIVALRDSARRSHHKLFKLIRKYRSILGQPAEPIMRQELPGPVENGAHSSVTGIPNLSSPVDPVALSVCEAYVPNFTLKSKRFINVSGTVKKMDDMSQIPASKLNNSEYLELFTENLINSTAELQKATPSVLTEENKDIVKHLKSRKRKLFADTLKELRQMGIKFNLGTSALEQQESASVIFANVNHVQSVDGLAALDLDTYFHRTIDLLPRARIAVREHSEDLSNAEVTRSVGFLEGLLQLVLKQREHLSTAVTNLNRIISVIGKVEHLWAPGKYSLERPDHDTDFATRLRWLPTLLRVALRLVDIHCKLGGVEYPKTRTMVDSWMKHADESLSRLSELPELPDGIRSTLHKELLKDTEFFAEAIRTELDTPSKDLERVQLQYVLNQLRPWVTAESQGDDSVSPPAYSSDVSNLDKKISNVCDLILGAVEGHSKTIDTLTVSADESTWFVRNDDSLKEQITSLRSGHIVKHIEAAVQSLASINLREDGASSATGALFAVALPILRQYQKLLSQSLLRYAELHRSTSKMTFILSKTFTQIAAQGFCTPAEKSDEQDGQTEKLEGGTGLGEGEGAEDISKDIQEDEDLSELAQEPNKSDKQEIEDEEDAVDMADQEMEGEMGEGEEKDDEKGSGDEEEEGDEIDEEAGDIDDLDANAVDEKMWDGEGEDADKEQEGDQAKGKKDTEESVAAQNNDKRNEPGEEAEEADDEEQIGAEENEEVRQDEVERHDPHAEEAEALDLPEDMELDGDEKEQEGSDIDDGMDGLSDVQDDGIDEHEEPEVGHDEDMGGEDVPDKEDEDMGSDLGVDVDEKEADEPGKDTEEAGEQVDEEDAEEKPEDQERLLREQGDDATADPENTAPSDAIGAGEDQDQEAAEDPNSSSKAQREKGSRAGEASEEQEGAAEDGEAGQQTSGKGAQDQSNDTQDSTEAQSFKKLGDTLEKWYRQQSKIRDAQQQEKDKSQEIPPESNDDNKEFQHLQDEEAEADAQALGTATEEQAHALDESMAIDTETKDLPETFQPDEVDEPELGQKQEEDTMDVDEPTEPQDSSTKDLPEGQAGAMIRQANPEHQPDDLDNPEDPQDQAPDLSEEVEEVDTQLLTTHLDDPNNTGTPLPLTQARTLWLHHTSLTHSLSLALTEHLRLILAPTLATKLRGDYRTGKRLNMKRIIPYIASSYRRDKIWLRRSHPSKRSYQILLAVDDSQSMALSGASNLALATLAMLSTSLSMLEAGQLAVLAFGDDVRVAHGFDAPFSADAGPAVFSRFGFDRPRTDVTKLVRETIDLFRDARRTAPSSTGTADLWQLALIISDGVCASSEHAPIARLLREAEEARIMVVFIVVDDVASSSSPSSNPSTALQSTLSSAPPPPTTGSKADNNSPFKRTSVLDLKEAKFVKDEVTGESKVKVERYLDSFPFRYYLIVRAMNELPGALAGVLRLWFEEVAEH